MANNNNKIRLFCSTCCQEFGNSNELNRHMEKHNSEVEMADALVRNAIACSFCGLQFRDQNALMAHHAAKHSAMNQDNQWQDFNNFINPVVTAAEPQQNSAAMNFTTTTTSNNNTDVVKQPIVIEEQCAFQAAAEKAVVMAPQNDGDISVVEKPVPSTSGSNSRLSVNKIKIPPEMSNIVTAPPNNSTAKSNEPAESCTECSLTFPTGVDLKKHIDLAHQGRQGGRQYQCLQCAAEFDDTKSHRAHMEMHTKEKPFKCDKCGLHLTNAAGLKRHMKRVHDKCGQNYPCPDCGKTFFQRFDLNRHVKVHSNPKCDKCGKQKVSDKHVCKNIEQPGDPQFKCSICDAQLDNKLAWGCHMWKHTKDPSYIQTGNEPPILQRVAVVSSKKSDNHSLKKNSSFLVKKTTPKEKENVAAKASTSVAAKQVDNNNAFPLAPEAHATTYNSQSSQPLCLQTSGFVPEEEPVKPLNMQVVNSG